MCHDAGVPVSGFDHVAITVADVDATIAWYERVLGAEPLHLDLWREGKLPIALLQVGASRLSVHPASAPAAPHADTPIPGSADLCFRFDGPVAEILALPPTFLPRSLPLAPSFSSWASAGKAGRSPGLDGNLLELLTLDGGT